MSTPSKRPRYENRDTADIREEEAGDKSSQDPDYFRSYADIAVHEEMLNDMIRTQAYRRGILKNYGNLRGKVVADVGAGTGILSMFCVHAGARKVFAVEACDMAAVAKQIVQENKMADRIEVLHDKVENVEFSEQLDVIVSEWMGYTLFYESMLPSVLHTRDKWLKQDGIILPSAASLYLAPFYDEDYEDRLEFWSEIRSVYKVGMEAMIPYAQKCIASHAHVKCLSPESVQARSHQVCALDMMTVKMADIEKVESRFEFQCYGHSQIHGFMTWFSVEFPGGVNLTTSPYEEETHWAQTLFYVEDPFGVQQDAVIKGKFTLSPNKNKPRFLDITITYRVNSGPEKSKLYFMNDCIT